MKARALGIVLAGIAAFAPATAVAQANSTAIRIIYPFAGGGSGDALARLIADEMGTRMKQSVVVEPRPGAAGRLGVRAVKSAPPDGKTLLITPIAPMAIYPSVYVSLEYDPVKDFAPISQLAVFDFGLAVGPQVPAKSLVELVKWVKADAARGNFGTPGVGTLPHFFGFMFAKSAGIALQHVAYKGATAALNDVVGGHLAIVISSTNELTELHKGNRLRVLATSGKERSPFMADVPTFRELGMNIEGTGWWGLFAPAGTPAATIAELNAVISTAVSQADIREKIKRFGLQPTGTSAEEFARVQREDIDRWAQPVRESGFRPEQ